MGEAVAGPCVGYQCILGFFEGAQHGLLIAGEGDVGARPGAGDLRLDPAEIERRPGDSRAYEVAAAGGFTQATARARDISEIAVEGHLGKQVTDGNPDERGGGRQLALRHTDVRPAAQQAGRIPDGGDPGQLRQLVRRAQ